MDIWFILLRVLTAVALFTGAAIGLWNAWAVLQSNRRKLAKVWSVVLAVCFLVALYVGLVFHLIGYTANY